MSYRAHLDLPQTSFRRRVLAFDTQSLSGCYLSIPQWVIGHDGTRRLRPPQWVNTPPWDLVLVLRALMSPPSKPMVGAQLKWLSYKTELLCLVQMLTSVKRVGD